MNKLSIISGVTACLMSFTSFSASAADYTCPDASAVSNVLQQAKNSSAAVLNLNLNLKNAGSAQVVPVGIHPQLGIGQLLVSLCKMAKHSGKDPMICGGTSPQVTFSNVVVRNKKYVASPVSPEIICLYSVKNGQDTVLIPFDNSTKEAQDTRYYQGALDVTSNPWTVLDAPHHAYSYCSDANNDPSKCVFSNVN